MSYPIYLSSNKQDLSVVTSFRLSDYLDEQELIKHLYDLNVKKKMGGVDFILNELRVSLHDSSEEPTVFDSYLRGHLFEGALIASKDSDYRFLALNLPKHIGSPVEVSKYAHGCFQELLESIGLNPVVTNINFTVFKVDGVENDFFWHVYIPFRDSNVKSLAYSVIENIKLHSK